MNGSDWPFGHCGRARARARGMRCGVIEHCRKRKPNSKYFVRPTGPWSGHSNVHGQRLRRCHIPTFIGCAVQETIYDVLVKL